MKITIDVETKTILLKEKVNILELIKWVKDNLTNWKEYELETDSEVIYIPSIKYPDCPQINPYYPINTPLIQYVTYDTNS